MDNIVTMRDRAYIELVNARKELAYFTQLCMAPLPKHAYSKRKNGKKVKLHATAIRRGNKKLGTMTRFTAPTSKFNGLHMMKMKAQIMLNQREEEFRELLKDYKDKGGSIKAALANANSV